MPFTKCFPYRPHDYVYDPLFTVSGPIDHYKAGIIAKMSTVKFQICPIFSNMFSDLPHHPRYQMVERKSKPIEQYESAKQRIQFSDPALKKKVDVIGADRAKFCYNIVNLPTKDMLATNDMPRFTIEKVDDSAMVLTETGVRRTRDVCVGTKYRDSEAQTVPWEPPYKIIGDKGDPEILKLEFLKWGSGLPAGMHEIRLIERARMKRAWEMEIKPDLNDEKSVAKFRDFVEALEMDEWAFREQEIQEIQELRLHLLEMMLKELHETSVSRTEDRLIKFAEKKMKEKQEKLTQLRKKTARELRKLEMARRGMSRKYKVADIVEEHASKDSELYAPLLRHGEHPKRWHMVIDEHMKRYRAKFIGVEQLNTLPRWLDQATNLKEFNKKPKGGVELCIRETKWTAPVLKELYEELQNLRKKSVNKHCTLRTRIEEKAEESTTPEVEGIPQLQEDQYDAIVTLQSLIKGRATQTMIYEGRDNCKELILELKNSVGLLKRDKEEKAKDKLKVRLQQREETVQSVMVKRLQGSLGKLQGGVVGTLLDFLNKELRRLIEERKAHAMCSVNERERKIREAAEAGRRQKELRRRREHDEMFKQIAKVTQESVDLYLQDIITEGMNFSCEEEAQRYVLNLSQKIDDEVEYAELAYATPGVLEEDEMVADMLHHFVLPEVEKQLVRKRVHQTQKQKLRTVHDAIYNKLERLPKVERVIERESTTESNDIPEFSGVEESESESVEILFTEENSAENVVIQILKEITDTVVEQTTKAVASDIVDIYMEPKSNFRTVEFVPDESYFEGKEEIITEPNSEAMSSGGGEKTDYDSDTCLDFSVITDPEINSVSDVGLHHPPQPGEDDISYPPQPGEDDVGLHYLPQPGEDAPEELPGE